MKKSKLVLTLAICIVSILNVPFWVCSIGEELIVTEIQEDFDVFDGYENYEVTPTGRTGYNIAVELPNEEVLKIGFDPQNESVQKKNEYYSIADGWQIKLPYFTSSTYYAEQGKKYTYKKDKSFKNIIIEEYPISYKCFVEQPGAEKVLLQESYGVQKVFNEYGCLTEYTNEFGDLYLFKYGKEGLESIVYPDGSMLRILKKGNRQIDLLLEIKNQTVIVAKLKKRIQNGGIKELESVHLATGNEVAFSYVYLNKLPHIVSYEINDCTTCLYKRSFEYESYKNYFRVSSVQTQRSNESFTAKYSYDNNGFISMINKGDIIESFNYSVNDLKSLTINYKTEAYGESSFRTIEYNAYAQICKYSYPQHELTLEYDRTNRVIRSNDENGETMYSYDSKGLLSYSYHPDGMIKKYEYDSNGKLLKSYQILTLNNTNLGSSNLNTYLQDSIDLRSMNANVQVLYHINTSVSVINWTTAYNIPQNSFNCYLFSIGKANMGFSVDPGYFSNLNLMPISISHIKLLTEQDQEALGRSTYDTTVNATHNSHTWKVAIRVRADEDYHFMKRSYNSAALPTYWEFKAGRGGPVMRLRGNKTPSSVTWDVYQKNIITNKYEVLYSGFYNSTIKYICIVD